MTKEQIIQNIKIRISAIESYRPEEYVLNKGIVLELKDLLLMIEKDEPSLSINLEKAAKQFANTSGNYGDYDICFDTDLCVAVDDKDYVEKAFKAGAKWMAEQGYSQEETVEDKCLEVGYDTLPGISPIINLPDSFKPGEKVIVQIRKKH